MAVKLDGFHLFGRTGNNSADEVILGDVSDTPNDAAILLQKMDQLTICVEKLQMQIEALKSSNTFELYKQPESVKNSDNPSFKLTDGKIRKYSKIAKVFAHIIEIFADGAIVIVNGIQEADTVDLKSSNEPSKQDKSSKKLDISGILKSTEGLLSSLSSSLVINKKEDE